MNIPIGFDCDQFSDLGVWDFIDFGENVFS
jgi:hypothetical protein